MDPRQEALLASVIKKYVQTAQPVSSKFLEKEGFFSLKSATIRLGMNDLEERGYLAQLHTSGGRIPTDKAYRYFVDNFVSDKEQAISGKLKTRIKEAIHEDVKDPRRINKNVAQILSELSDNLIITNILEEDDFFKVGLSSLFEMPEFREFEKVFQVTSFFDEFENLFKKIEGELFHDEDYEFQDLRVFIGRENPLRDIKDETIMFAKYDLPHNYTGSLTLIGPTRMDYEKNIGLIKYTTEELNKMAKRA